MRQKLFIFSDNIINKKDTIITIFVHNKKNIISFNIKIKPNGLTQDVNNIGFLLSFGCNSSDKLRSIHFSKNKLISEYERLHDINNDIANKLKSDTKHHANSFLNCI
jgi:hypothetical protein